MNIEINIGGGGIFSKLMLAFQAIDTQILDVNDIESVTFNNVDERIDNEINIYEFIYKQTNVEPDNILIPHLGCEVYHDEIPQYNLDRLRIIISKLELNDELIISYNEIKKDILNDSGTLGVHVRLGSDMNYWHGDIYGNKYISDYIKAIDEETKKNSYDYVYVACDNEESLSELIKVYGNKIKYHNDFIRSEQVNDDEYNFLSSNLTNKKMWMDTFIDMLLLSECGTLIHRVSNFANMSKIYSKHITNKSILI